MAGPYVQWATKATCMIAVALTRKLATQEQGLLGVGDFQGPWDFRLGLILVVWEGGPTCISKGLFSS